MWRTLKLITNLFITTLVFNFFIVVLTLMLNPQISATGGEFLLLYLNLYAFYGPAIFLVVGAVFFVIQFFAEKKYPIGIFSPPTITYFLSFTILLVSFAFYLNYDYYLEFFNEANKSGFVKILLLNLVLIITGVVFAMFRWVNKRWLQVVFLIVLVFNIFYSYTTVIYDNRVCEFTPEPLLPVKTELSETERQRRKIKIVIMEGLSLKFIYQLSSEQRLLNFNELINKGTNARIRGYRPNMSLSLLNSALSGLKPSSFSPHSVAKFKFPGVPLEFDVKPRYIFFRKLSYFNTASFFNKNENYFLDFIGRRYHERGHAAIHNLQPSVPPIYSEKALQRNNRFVPLYPDVVNNSDEKFSTVKKAFFFDDYLMNSMRLHWRNGDNGYSIVRFPGLSTVCQYFSQYQDPQLAGGDIPDHNVKKYGKVLEKYYEYYDSIIGNLLTTTGDNELLVVISFFEYEPLPVWRRIIVNMFDQKDVYVYRSLSSQGTVLFYEKNALKKDYSLPGMSIYDIYPTLLYYAGFQLPRNLEGEVVREIFTDEFVLNNPIDIETDMRR